MVNTYTGSCYCRSVQYQLQLNSPEEARTSICHCHNCKKFTGCEGGITSKVPRSAFRYTQGEDHLKKHVGDNGSGTKLTREFCSDCGSGIMEFGENAGDHTYIFYGTLDNPDALPPKGEFFMKHKAGWMPEVPNVFHKNEIKE